MSPVEFFYLNAGFSYTPGKETEEQGRQRCAEALAEAERKANDAGYTFEWSIDGFSDSSHWDNRPRAIAKADAYAVWSCLARDGDGEVVTSLGGIDFGRDGEPWGNPYRRVIEAELALEVLG